MEPWVSGLFYSTKLHASLPWWKQPQNFTSKKVLRWIEHGVKVEFQKGLAFKVLCRNPRSRNSSTHKMWISRFADYSMYSFNVSNRLARIGSV